MLKGIPVSNGVAIGKAYLLDRSKVCILKTKIHPDKIDEEIKRFRQAIEKSKDQIQKTKKRARKVVDKYAIILDTYTLLLEDEILVSETIENIKREQINAEWALTQTIEKFNKLFDNINDEYLKGKQDDLDLVGHRVIRNLMGHPQESLAEIIEPVIIISHALSPSDTLMMSKSSILGMATEVGGKTSHVGIFASALGIPAVVGVRDLTSFLNTGDQVIIDALEGTLISNPSPDELQQYTRKQQNYRRYENKLLEETGRTAETLDGHPIQLMANIESAHEVKSAQRYGAHGIGLYRTEFLYLGSNSQPTENELFVNFKKVIECMDPFPVVIRTLDIGGDKLFRNQSLDPEANPALGLRGIRMSLSRPERFLCQLRAILRASLFGRTKILYPMVSSLEEIQEANETLDRIKDDLRREQIPFDEDIEVGAMIETPAAALCVDQIIQAVDFVSIGTNDLIQYVLAVDRTNENVAHLYQPFHPSIQRLLKDIFQKASEAGKPVCICGELGGDPMATLLLLGLGRLDELSMEPHSIPKVKKIIRRVKLDEAKQFAEKVLQLSSQKEINQLVSEEMRRRFPSDFDRNQAFEEKNT